MKDIKWECFCSIIDNEEIDFDEKMLLITLFKNYDFEKGYYYLTNEKLKKIIMSESEADYYKALKSLQNKKIIVKENIDENRCKIHINFNIL